MASTSTNPFTSFTITQPFLGAPLNFVPALGSQELEQLVDAYVLGNASKQDKLSEVTIDFYNHATVDLNTGALVKTYNVFAFEQSPSESQSSFSPSMYTPSPSASMSFGDSAYGSLSMTPPARKSGGRVSKKPTKKDAKKVAEARLPGFSIMTKDGIDVTSTAGRGTKTKEQREHAHLMRIMRACDACKKKKIRCDPSHSRQSNEMSRCSTVSTGQTFSGSGGGSNSRVNPSPTLSTPSLSQESSIPSQSNTPSYGAIDDFVLFPEDGSSWNPADMSIAEDADLSQFNFDINLDIPMNSGDFDFSNFDSMQQVDFNQLSYLPATPQLGMDQWAGLPSSHSRPHPSSFTQDARQLDVNSQDSWIDALADSIYNRRAQPSSFSQESGESSIFSTSNVSPQTVGTLADEIWPDGPGDSLSSSQSNGHVRQPPSQRSLDEPSADLSPMNSSTTSPYLSHTQSRSDGSPTAVSNYSPAEWSGAGSLASSRSSLQTDNLQYWTELTDKTRRGHESPAAALASRQLSSSSSSSSQGHDTDSTAREERPATRVYTGLQHREGIPSQSPTSLQNPPRPTQSSLGFSNDVFGLANTCTLVSESLRSVKQGLAECPSLSGDLQKLRTVLVQYNSATLNANIQRDDVGRDTAGQIHAFGQQLQRLSATLRQCQVQDSPLPQGYLPQCQLQIRKLLRSLCARINSLQTPGTGSPSAGGDFYQPLTSGRNLQLFVPSFEGHDRDRHTELRAAPGIESLYDDHLNAQDSRSTPPRPDSHAVLLQEDEKRYALAFYKDSYQGAFAPGVDSGSTVTAIQDTPSYSLLTKQVDCTVVKASSDGLLENTEIGSGMRTSPDDQEQHARGNLNSVFQIIDRQQEIAEETQPSVQYVGRSRDESQLEVHDAFSRGSIPRTTVSNVGAVAFAPVLDTVMHYSKVIVCAAMASALVASITQTSVSMLLSLFIPVSALLLSAPRQVQLAALACLAVLAVSNTVLFKDFQKGCQEWTEGSSLASIARVAVCATLVATPPSLSAVATRLSLLGGKKNDCYGANLEVDSPSIWIVLDTTDLNGLR
ncbi:hypothetical protein LSUB1_G003382 [Lachnellula subtilissima]|uniref:Zn(2)-C6 fungal-type domain-containing protein n=1 Tax=Lachnellula subtilissima TaxID=602034 RepID=A0A8H8RSJ5_9HELO|nr:hypothetical protein LSUB1_G003382 [Lachnellula subtilissima]